MPYQTPFHDFVFPDESGKPSSTLYRILEHDFKGVPVNRIRLAVEAGADVSMFAIEVDIDDYIARGNPFTSSHATTAGGMRRESISIRSDAVIAGSVRVSTAHAVPGAPGPDIEAALR